MEHRSALQDTADELAATKLEVDAALKACDEEIDMAEKEGHGQDALDASEELELLLKEKAKLNKAIEAKQREMEQRALREDDRASTEREDGDA